MSDVVKLVRDKIDESGKYAYLPEIAEELGGKYISEEIVDQTRWKTIREHVLGLPNNKYVIVCTADASTENTDGDDPSDWDIWEVYPHEVTMVVFKPTPQV